MPLVDPLAALEVILASGTFSRGLLIGVAVVLVAATLLGRVFCGWLCPLGLLLDLAEAIQRRLRHRIFRRPRPTFRSHISKTLKYWLLLACVALSLTSGLPIFTTISPINLGVLALLHSMRMGFVVLGVVILLDIAFPRGFCRAICPLGALYALIGRKARPAIQVGSDRSCLSGCRSCSLQCPMGIPVRQAHVQPAKPAVDDGECTRCGTCVDGCPTKLLALGWTRTSRASPRGDWAR